MCAITWRSAVAAVEAWLGRHEEPCAADVRVQAVPAAGAPAGLALRPARFLNRARFSSRGIVVPGSRVLLLPPGRQLARCAIAACASSASCASRAASGDSQSRPVRTTSAPRPAACAAAASASAADPRRRGPGTPWAPRPHDDPAAEVLRHRSPLQTLELLDQRRALHVKQIGRLPLVAARSRSSARRMSVCSKSRDEPLHLDARDRE